MITGVDLSKEMLTIAKSKVRKEKLCIPEYDVFVELSLVTIMF